MQLHIYICTEIILKRLYFYRCDNLQSTLIFDDGFSMTYLIPPMTLSFHDANQVTVLSCLTSFHLCPAGGTGTLESLKHVEIKNELDIKNS